MLYALFLHCLRLASCSPVSDAPDARLLELVMTKEFSFSGRSGGSLSLTLASTSVCIASMGARVTLMPTVVKEPEPFSWS